MELPEIRYLSCFNHIDYKKRFQYLLYAPSTGQIQQDSHGPCYLDMREMEMQMMEGGLDRGVWLHTADGVELMTRLENIIVKE